MLTDDQSEIFNEKDFMRLSKQLPKRLVILLFLYWFYTSDLITNYGHMEPVSSYVVNVINPKN